MISVYGIFILLDSVALLFLAIGAFNREIARLLGQKLFTGISASPITQPLHKCKETDPKPVIGTPSTNNKNGSPHRGNQRSQPCEQVNFQNVPNSIDVNLPAGGLGLQESIKGTDSAIQNRIADDIQAGAPKARPFDLHAYQIRTLLDQEIERDY